MDASIKKALENDLTIDITTIGRKSGTRRRTEIWFHRVEGRYIITGTPGKRDWYANLLANTGFTFHLKGSVKADLPARAVPITDPAEKRKLLLAAPSIWNRPNRKTVETWVKGAPLVEVIFES